MGTKAGSNLHEIRYWKTPVGNNYQWEAIKYSLGHTTRKWELMLIRKLLSNSKKVIQQLQKVQVCGLLSVFY